MIRREYRNGPFIIMCDECEDAQELEGHSFQYAEHDAKRTGWKFLPIEDTVRHYCEICVRVAQNTSQ